MRWFLYYGCFIQSCLFLPMHRHHMSYNCACRYGEHVQLFKFESSTFVDQWDKIRPCCETVCSPMAFSPYWPWKTGRSLASMLLCLNFDLTIFDHFLSATSDHDDAWLIYTIHTCTISLQETAHKVNALTTCLRWQILQHGWSLSEPSTFHGHLLLSCQYLGLEFICAGDYISPRLHSGCWAPRILAIHQASELALEILVWHRQPNTLAKDVAATYWWSLPTFSSVIAGLMYVDNVVGECCASGSQSVNDKIFSLAVAQL